MPGCGALRADPSSDGKPPCYTASLPPLLLVGDAARGVAFEELLTAAKGRVVGLNLFYSEEEKERDQASRFPWSADRRGKCRASLTTESHL